MRHTTPCATGVYFKAINGKFKRTRVSRQMVLLTSAAKHGV